MFVTIINDCKDGNVIGRQGSRIGSLLGVSPTYVGVGNGLMENNDLDPAELEAAGCLVDSLDASAGGKGIILVNVANRHAKGKKWPNGTPFGFFWYKETLVISTVDGNTLSLIKKLGLTHEIFLMDVATVMHDLVAKGIYSEDIAAHVINTQFRSFDFTPRVGAYLISGGSVPYESYSMGEVADLEDAVWYIDNFGNSKTTLLREDLTIDSDNTVQTRFGKVKVYNRLKDVPNGETALIVGSSGIDEKRFVEFIVQGKPSAQVYHLQVGSRLF